MFTRFTFPAALAAGILALSGPALADWSASVISLGGVEGGTGAIDCPAGGTFGTVWGTGTYTSDSSICTAAVHYGWIVPGVGSRVSYRVVPGQQGYQGSAQNGVTSLDYGQWNLSFQITGAEVSGGAPGATPIGARPIDWSTTLDTLGPLPEGQSLVVHCPPGSSEAPVWGNGIYTSDSAICRAAQHAGRVSPASGGTVTLLQAGSRTGFAGTQSNGVTSLSYGPWESSYWFQ